MPSLQLPEAVRLLFEDVVDVCRGLEHFSFSDQGPDNFNFSFDELDKRLLLTIDTIKPLLSCRKLIFLKIRHQCPLLIIAEDIQELACAFPMMEHLTLNPNPREPNAPNL
jgi:hypothetical protein